MNESKFVRHKHIGVYDFNCHFPHTNKLSSNMYQIEVIVSPPDVIETIG